MLTRLSVITGCVDIYTGCTNVVTTEFYTVAPLLVWNLLRVSFLALRILRLLLDLGGKFV